MIVVIATMETDPVTGRQKCVVSHGINTANSEKVVLPNVDPRELKARYDDVYGEYVID